MSSPARHKNLRIPAHQELIDALNAARGEMPMAEFVRRLMYKSLARRGYQVSRMPDGRGQYDREAAGLLSRRTVSKRKRRVLVQRATERWRTKRTRQRIADAKGPMFELFDEGVVMGRFHQRPSVQLGIVSADGAFLPETGSRFSVGYLEDGIARAIEAQPDRRWPSRYQRFIERVRLS